jgi:hypothetical protein
VYAYSGGVYDYTHATVKCTPGVLGDGSQLASVTLVPSNGDRSTSYNWTFGMAEKPKLGVVSPASGSTVSTLRPAITIGASDNGTIASSIVTVDGIVVPSAYDATAKLVRVTLPSDLTNLSSHTVAASVTDAGGNTSSTSWTFSTAMPVTTFSGESPAAGAMLSSAVTTIQVDAACTVSLVDSFVSHPLTRVTIDGVAYPWDLRNPGGDPARATVYAYPPASAWTDGPHTIAVTIGNALGASATKTWQVNVGIAPTFGEPTPAAGSTVTTTSPTILVPASDNSAVTGWSASVNGLTVPASYSGGSVRLTLPGNLPDDSTNSVKVTASDAMGLSEELNWSFKTQVNPEMADQATDCLMCHADPHTYATGCTECHEPKSSGGNGIFHAGTPSDYHAAADALACRPCHVSAITVEHARYSLSCETCHVSSDPAVTAAIAAGDTRCATCHPAADHESLHTTTVDAACTGSGCHTGTSLTSIHINSETDLDCDSCHKSAEGDVISAIATSDKSCAACHGSEGHEAAHATTVSPECATCHSGTSLTSIHMNSGTSLDCDSCHESADPDVVGAISARDKSCAACHDAQPHPGLPAAHSATAIGSGDVLMGLNDGGDHSNLSIYVDCGRCHITDLAVQHANQCQYCHSGLGTPSAPGGTWNKSCQQGACHPTIHADTLATEDHFGAYWNSSSSCDSCHDGGDPWPGSGDNCEGCHSSSQTIPDHLAPETSSDAVGAYSGTANITLSAVDFGGSGVAASFYKLDFGAWQPGSEVAVAGPSSGTAIHTLQYYSTDVAGNGEAPKSATFSIAGPGPADTTGPVGTMTVSNDAAYVNSGGAYITASMSDAGTGLYGQSVDPGTGTFGAWTVYSSNQYASLPAPDGLKTVRVQYKDYSGNVTAKSDTVTRDTVGPVSTTGATNGASYYGNQSFMPSATDALSGVNRTYVQVDGGAYTSYIGPTGPPVLFTAPASGAASHSIRCYAVDNVGNTGSTSIASFVVYANTDVTPPNGTMSINSGALATNLSAATVNSTVSDTGSGMSQMRVDQAGTGAYGAWIAYSASYSIALPTGNGTKTVNVQYRDVSNNVLTLSDTIIYDATAPAGTMSVNNGAAETSVLAVTVNSAVTDSPSGMYQMRIDPGSGTYGAWIAYAASSPITLPSGNGSKTVRVQYTDNAGNVTTLIDTILVSIAASDTTPPTTTSSVVGGQSYQGDQTFTFAGTDSGSGVASTWYKLDTGAWTLGTSVLVSAPLSGSASHVLSWYSIDIANNQEAENSATFTMQPSAGGSATFNFTGGDQTFTVPSGVTALTIDLYGGEGGEFDGQAGGLGGGVHALVPVTPGQVLTVRVGEGAVADSVTGGWPNGGNGSHGGSGGGSTSILFAGSYWLEAGAGGGGDHNGSDGGPGGAAGSLPGGGQAGENAEGAAGGGGWNGGAGYTTHDGGGDGGTSYIAIGTGLLSEGANAGDGSVAISW